MSAGRSDERAPKKLDAGKGLFRALVGPLLESGLVRRSDLDSDVTIPSRLGRYEILRPLGRGATSEVYLARDPLIGREVAVKVLKRISGQTLERFRREMQVLAGLKHPHIVSIHDAGVVGGHPWFVMDYVERQLDVRGLALREGVVCVEQVARACQAAHERGIVHRDLKPGNILIGKEGAVVADFGLAKLLEGDARDLSGEGAVLGTPLYMAPEQILGKTIDARTDVHALGAILYELMCGRAPFEGPTFRDVSTAIVEHAPAPPRTIDPTLPEALETVALRALAKDPARRQQTAGEVADALRAWLDRPPPRRNRTAIALVLAAAASVAVTVLLRARDAKEPGESPVAPIPSPTATTAPVPSAAAEATTVDASTLNGKLLCTYQGRLRCPGDGGPGNTWGYWFAQKDDAAHADVDLWPDTRELDADELFPTSLALPDGRRAALYSAWNPKTVARHFKWMRESAIDGVLVRVDAGDALSVGAAADDRLVDNVRAGAEAWGRVFALEYEVLNRGDEDLVDRLEMAWRRAVSERHVVESDRYLRHRGRPVVAIHGLGFNAHSGTPVQAEEIVRWFQANAEPRYRASLLLTLLPSQWRSLGAWSRVYRSVDVLSPGTVGSYEDAEGVDTWRRSQLEPDLAECRRLGVDYLPVVFPGLSRHNVRRSHGAPTPSNQVPRQGGAFYWRQLHAVKAAGCAQALAEGFDNCTQGTALFKVAPTRAEQPAEGDFVPLDVDGVALPSDWYLKLTGAGARMLRGESPLEATIPARLR